MTLSFHKKILEERPELYGKPAFKLAAHVMRIGDEVFKLCHAKALRTDEVTILKRLDGYRLPIPRVTYVGEIYPFFGMTHLPGIRLENAAFADKHEEKSLAQEIADFVLRMAQALRRTKDGYVMHRDLNEGNVLVDPFTRRLTGIIDFEFTARIPQKEMLKKLNIRFFNKLSVKAATEDAFAQRIHELPEMHQ